MEATIHPAHASFDKGRADMKNTGKRQFSPAVLATSIAAIGFLAPLVAQAEQSPGSTRDTASLNNQIEVGGGYVSDAS